MKVQFTITIKHSLFICILVVGILQSCVSVKKYNASIAEPKTVTQLHADIDYIHRKLEKLHPDLYHYISKSKFDWQFDSLKTTITKPMTSNELFFKLSPIIASIKQGHTRINPVTKRLTKKELKLVAKGLTPLSRLDLELIDNKLYISKNFSTDSTLKSGTEIVTIDNQSPLVLINKYSNTFASDGDNKTFINKVLGRSFTRFFYYEYGLIDSVRCELRYSDSTRFVILKRNVTSKKNKQPEKLSKAEKRAFEKKKKTQGYDSLRKQFCKELKFVTSDSSVALMKIVDFSRGNYKKFYKTSFQQLNATKTATLIIDLRDNPGGSLHEIYTLYKYLADTTFTFVDKSEVTSPTSLWHNGVIGGIHSWKQVPRILLLPFIVGQDIYNYLKTKKGDDGKYYYKFPETRSTKTAECRFKGKVYVLINGGSFSASSIISSNLKATKRATFVGEETGGAFNGCVAGFMPVRTLPNTKLQVRFGLAVCKVPYTAEPDGRGIFPDVELKQTPDNLTKGVDAELEWILNDVKQHKLKYKKETV